MAAALALFAGAGVRLRTEVAQQQDTAHFYRIIIGVQLKHLIFTRRRAKALRGA